MSMDDTDQSAVAECASFRANGRNRHVFEQTEEGSLFFARIFGSRHRENSAMMGDPGRDGWPAFFSDVREVPGPETAVA